MKDRRPIALLFLYSLLLILCFVSCASNDIRTTIASSINCDKREGKDQMNDTLPTVIERLQNLPVLLHDGTESSSTIIEQKQYRVNDFLPLQVGISTLDDLLPVIGEYPAIVTSYGLCYNIQLEEGGELSVKVNNYGVIFEMEQSGHRNTVCKRQSGT